MRGSVSMALAYNQVGTLLRMGLFSENIKLLTRDERLTWRS